MFKLKNILSESKSRITKLIDVGLLLMKPAAEDAYENSRYKVVEFPLPDHPDTIGYNAFALVDKKKKKLISYSITGASQFVQFDRISKKLKESLLSEDQKFAARSTNSGKVVYYKSRENTQNAIKSGKAEKLKSKDDTSKKSDGSKKKPARLSSEDHRALSLDGLTGKQIKKVAHFLPDLFDYAADAISSGNRNKLSKMQSVIRKFTKDNNLDDDIAAADTIYSIFHNNYFDQLKKISKNPSSYQKKDSNNSKSSQVKDTLSKEYEDSKDKLSQMGVSTEELENFEDDMEGIYQDLITDIENDNIGAIEDAIIDKVDSWQNNLSKYPDDFEGASTELANMFSLTYGEKLDRIMYPDKYKAKKTIDISNPKIITRALKKLNSNYTEKQLSNLRNAIPETEENEELRGHLGAAIDSWNGYRGESEEYVQKANDELERRLGVAKTVSDQNRKSNDTNLDKMDQKSRIEYASKKLYSNGKKIKSKNIKIRTAGNKLLKDLWKGKLNRISDGDMMDIVDSHIEDFIEDNVGNPSSENIQKVYDTFRVAFRKAGYDMSSGPMINDKEYSDIYTTYDIDDPLRESYTLKENLYRFGFDKKYSESNRKPANSRKTLLEDNRKDRPERGQFYQHLDSDNVKSNKDFVEFEIVRVTKDQIMIKGYNKNGEVMIRKKPISLWSSFIVDYE